HRANLLQIRFRKISLLDLHFVVGVDLLHRLPVADDDAAAQAGVTRHQMLTCRTQDGTVHRRSHAHGQRHPVGGTLRRKKMKDVKGFLSERERMDGRGAGFLAQYAREKRALFCRAKALEVAGNRRWGLRHCCRAPSVTSALRSASTCASESWSRFARSSRA